MMNRLVILQPSYLPWLGFFDMLYKSDVFIIYDDVQYTKNDWRNRNRIKGSNGIIWLTVPVNDKNRISKSLMINDISIRNELPWAGKHINTLKMNYARSAFFEDVFKLLEPIISRKYNFLVELNMNLINAIAGYLDLNRKIVFSSETDTEDLNQVDRIVKLCEMMNATHYLTGDAARDYIDTERFARKGIQLEWHNYQHPVYNQLWGEFTQYLSIVDLLFNCGMESLNILIDKEA